MKLRFDIHDDSGQYLWPNNGYTITVREWTEPNPKDESGVGVFHNRDKSDFYLNHYWIDTDNYISRDISIILSPGHDTRLDEWIEIAIINTKRDILINDIINEKVLD